MKIDLISAHVKWVESENVLPLVVDLFQDLIHSFSKRIQLKSEIFVVIFVIALLANNNKN